MISNLRTTGIRRRTIIEMHTWRIVITAMAVSALAALSAHANENQTTEKSVDELVNAILSRVSPRSSDLEYLIGNRRGFVQNSNGSKCWYTQSPTRDESVSHFYEDWTGADSVMVFDDSQCMAGTGVDQDINVRMINNVIANWYSHPDAAFMTSRDDLRKTSFMQVEGFCVQSRTYKNQAFMVDYFTANGSIFLVVHNYAVQGCG